MIRNRFAGNSNRSQRIYFREKHAVAVIDGLNAIFNGNRTGLFEKNFYNVPFSRRNGRPMERILAKSSR